MTIKQLFKSTLLAAALSILVFTSAYSIVNASILPYYSGGTATGTLPFSGGVASGNGTSLCYTPTSTNGYVLIQSSTAPCGVAWVTVGGTGTVTSLTSGHGVTLNPSTITTTGVIATNTSTLLADIQTFGFLSNASITANAPITWSAGNVIGYNTSTAMSMSGTYTFLGGAVFTNATGSSNSSSLVFASGSFQNLYASAGVHVSSSITQTGGINQFASSTITGQATTTGLAVTSVTNAIHVGGSSGNVTGYSGSTCGSGFVSSVSATGTVACAATSTPSYTAQGTTISTGNLTIASSGPLNSFAVSGNTLTVTSISTSTILAGYSTSTNATLAQKYLQPLNGGLSVSSTIASSSFAFNIANATTTPGSNKGSIGVAGGYTMSSVSCYTSNGTTTVNIYRQDNLVQSTSTVDFVSALICGVTGATTSTFTSSSIPAGTWISATTTAVSGAPSSTFIFGYLTKI